MSRRITLLSALLTLVILTAAALTFSIPSQTVAFDPYVTAVPSIDPNTGALVPVGGIMAFGSDPAYPSSIGWLKCDGRAVYRSEYPYLFQVIGTIYGAGDGTTTFNLPDLRGRTIVGSGSGLGLTLRTVGDMVGEESHVLTITEMPSHNHQEHVFSGASSNSTPVYVQAVRNGVTGILSTGNTGGGAAFNVMQPSLVTTYYIYAGVDPVSPNIEVTVILVFPSHTPTPTLTPTLTPTNGPSPTPTATATATPIGEIGYQVGDQTILIRNDVRPGDLVIVGLLSVMTGLLLTMLFLLIRRRA